MGQTSSQPMVFRLGLTNKDSGDLSEYTASRGYIATAVCNSRACAGTHAGRTKGVEKKVSFSATFCPDCRSALNWKRKPRQEVSA